METLTAPPHTPGPWIFDEVPTSCGRCFRIGSAEMIDKHEASKGSGARTLPAYGCVYDDWGSGETVNKANARLMAAAPELLAALRPLASLAPAIKDDMADDCAIITARGPLYVALGIEGRTLISVGDVRRAVAAIAKAEGRAS